MAYAMAYAVMADVSYEAPNMCWSSALSIIWWMECRHILCMVDSRQHASQIQHSVTSLVPRQ